MKQPAFVALLTSAFALYLVALAAAGGAPENVGMLALLSVSLWSAFVHLWIKRDDLSRAPALVRTQAVMVSLTLASALAIEAYSLLGELTFAVSLSLLGFVTLELAVTAPDVPARLSRHVGSLGVTRMLSLVAAACGVLAALPPVTMFGATLIFPPVLRLAPLVYALSAFSLATLVRLFRRRLGSDTRALSGNVWPTIGLCVALGLSAAGGALRVLGAEAYGEQEVLFASAAFLLVLGHLWLVSTRKAKVAYAWARELWALTLALSLAGGATIWLALRVGQAWPIALVSGLLFTVLFELGRRGLSALSRRVLAPHGGRLLSAIVEIRESSLSALDHLETCAEVLRPLRRAAASPEAAPVIYTFHPAREVRLDAAGFARSTARPMPEALRKRLEAAPGAPIVRADVRQLLPRRPELRQLLWALDELSALCVLPLVTDGNLEGALVVAQGDRRDPLSLEELDALENLTRFLAPALSTMASTERLGARLSEREHEHELALEMLRDSEDQLAAVRAELSLLKESTSALTRYREPVRYSPKMRALCAQLVEVAPQDTPLVLVTEAGCEALELSAFIHRHSGFREGPLVVYDCADIEGDPLLTLCGQGGTPRRLGLLELAAEGSLVLCNIGSLPPSAQVALSAALSERRATPVGSSLWYPLRTRLIATSRTPIEELLMHNVLGPELGRWLAPSSYWVPPLRECPEDIESLALFALDRAGRVLGKNVPGLSPDALSALKEYDFPDNHRELLSVVERAVARAPGVRVEVSDLPPLPRGTLVLGSFIEQEREILRQALHRAGGNRTRAARALGLKRTTLLEKMRKLGLDEGQSGAQH